MLGQSRTNRVYGETEMSLSFTFKDWVTVCHPDSAESRQIRGPTIKVLDTHFCYFLPCHALQPSVKNKLVLEALEGFAHHKMKPCGSHFTVHTTTNNLVSGRSLFILSFHAHSRATLATDSTKINLQFYLWNVKLASNPSGICCLW